ncbi:MAG TPA: hypothetical protein DDY49_02410 [Paenibacillaceae bacterium]|nr:hypothetical protein [Paenibacillaceae bacterium]
MVEKRKRKGAFYLVLAILLSLTLSGCGNKKSMRESSNYKDTKHMVIDILKTPEGKKALQQNAKGESSKSEESGESSKSGESEGSKDEGSSNSESGSMKSQSKDIEKIIKQENKKQMKTMSSDPEFQKAIIAATKTPEFQNSLRIEMVQIMAQMQQGLMKPQSGEKKKGGKSGGGDGGSDGGGGEKGKMGQ